MTFPWETSPKKEIWGGRNKILEVALRVPTPPENLKKLGVRFFHTLRSLTSHREGLVLGSLVQSGFSSIFEKTETVTGPPCPGYSKKLDRTVIDWSTAVLYGFLRLRDRSKPVMVSTG